MPARWKVAPSVKTILGRLTPYKTTWLAGLSDIELLALCIWGEARGEPGIGQLAVAHVVLNRVDKPRWWGHDVRSVILQPYQFSFFNKLSTVILGPWTVQTMVAELALGKLTQDPTLGATHYHAVNANPDWAHRLRFLVQIGNHLFYEEDSDGRVITLSYQSRSR